MDCCRLLWVLDASINISMEPFRALVADKLPEEQRTYGFITQTLIIGIGTWIASNLPWFVSELGVSNEADAGVVPMSVKVAFSIGSFVFLSSIYILFLKLKNTPLKRQKNWKKLSIGVLEKCCLKLLQMLVACHNNEKN